jgi:imidazolonepropionase-like amidohydrolase
MHKPSVLLIVTGIGLLVVGIGSSVTSQSGAKTSTPPSPATFVIRNVRVFDGERVVPRTHVLVRDRRIAAIGPDIEVPAGAEVIRGDDRTLLPGLIDAHTHAFGDALERAAIFGVTTELDMFTDHRFAAAMRIAQRDSATALARADLFSAGTLVTAPGGHGTEYAVQVPTIASKAEADAFVDARIAEGSDYIKIVYDDGRSYGLTMPTIARDVMTSVVAAAKRRGKLAVIHVGSRRGAEEALDAGANGLVHVFADVAPDTSFVDQAVRARAFVIPTLTVVESTTGVASGASLVDDARISPFLTVAERAALKASFPRRAASKRTLNYAMDAVRRLHAAGVPILAGTDASNPGTAHGSSLHRELELLVSAGLTPAAALTAATATPAQAFGLPDRGRVAQGLRADLLLVEGDPTADITATRRIVAIWKAGARLERREAGPVTSAPVPTTDGAISDFDRDAVRAAFGAGWQVSTDRLMGGSSTATMTIEPGGARNTAGALAISGTLAAGAPYPWAGAMFFAGATPMAPVNASAFKELVFWTRGDGREYQVMVFAERLGNIPASQAFTARPEWHEVVMPFSAFSGIDGSDLKAVLFSSGPQPGAFRFMIDDVRLR